MGLRLHDLVQGKITKCSKLKICTAETLESILLQEVLQTAANNSYPFSAHKTTTFGLLQIQTICR